MNIKTNIFLFIHILLSGYLSYSQKENTTINLPKGDFEISTRDSGITPIYYVYVTKKGTVYLEDLEVDIPKLGSLIFKHKLELPEELRSYLQIHLYGDKKTPYTIIDAVKTEISSNRVNLMYRTGKDLELFKGINWRVHGTFNYLNEKSKDSIILKAPNDIFFPITIETIKNSGPLQVHEDLYSQNYNEAKKILQEFSYANIYFINGRELVVNNKKIKLSDIENIEEELVKYNLLFIRNSKELNYNEYIKNLSAIKSVYNHLRSTNISELPIFEISGELEQGLKQNNVKI